MRFVIQRVKEASVTAGEVTGSIGKGFMVLIGACQNDTKEIADKMVRKMLGLRIFEDENGKTNLSLSSVGGALLLVSQFTLYADCRKGNRPSFLDAGDPARLRWQRLVAHVPLDGQGFAGEFFYDSRWYT